MLHQSKLLLIDECTTLHNCTIEALNRTPRDIWNDRRLMGGLVVPLDGDFRQTLPIITKRTPAKELNSCLILLCFWDTILKMNLSANMKIQLHNDMSTGAFATELLKIGNGWLEADSNGKVTLAQSFCSKFQLGHWECFPTIKNNFGGKTFQKALQLCYEMALWKDNVKLKIDAFSKDNRIMDLWSSC